MQKKTGQSGELVFGIHSIIELLKAKKRKLISIYTTKPVPRAWAQIEPLLTRTHLNIQYVDKDVLSKIAGTADHQGVIAWAQPFPFRKKMFTPEKQKTLVMLDGVQDVGNLGAILRSVYCTGFDGVILCKSGAAPLTASAIKASAGLAEHLDIYVAPSAQAACIELTKAGYHLYVAALGGKNILDVEMKSPLCIVIGNEAIGVNPAVAKNGTVVTLPQRTPDISYNASVAAGILLFMVATQCGALASQ